MNLNKTPNSERLHIGIFGKRNTGKSSLINAITNQNIALVSNVAGTTTDPVYKSMEINGIGPCLFIDTAGFDDVGPLGELRNKKTLETIKKINIAIILITDDNLDEEVKFKNKIKNFPVIVAINKCDELKNIDEIKNNILNKIKLEPILISTKTKKNIDELIKLLIKVKPFDEKNIVKHLVKRDDYVLLVMPQDIQAPQGRLILPQVRIIRDLLDNKCIVTCVTKDNFIKAINFSKSSPKIIITDSQILKFVYDNKPKESLLTSFSILFSKYKGDINKFILGAEKIDELTENSKVLIAEACTHVPLDGDIGRIQIPNLLRKYVKKNILIKIVNGNNFPDDLSEYDLIIHCGACMFNRNYLLSRIQKAEEKNIAITNYGLAFAKLHNLLDKIIY
jgi:[FeFe] hydrogenase H-cluster maturation GTPase HydF